VLPKGKKRKESSISLPKAVHGADLPAFGSEAITPRTTYTAHNHG
jgi:hypothetical protein